MNRIGIISDIHGNYEALKTVLAELDKMGISEIYCLGDVVGYYSQVNECCDELRARNIPCLMGNHDWYMAGGGFCPRSKSVNDCLVYQRKVIRPDNIEWLRTFPVQRFVQNIHMVHGGWADPIDEYLLEPNEEYFSRIQGKVFMSGHTHLQSLHHFSGKTYCNPGSVGQPRDGDPRAAFAVYDGAFTLHRVVYDMQIVFDLMDKAGFNDYYYGGLQTGARNLRRL
ncbi:MAG TPA: metallophosphoesterase family protein [Chitinophagaceae bacterium]|jgi:putative phosphoesterase|nr:metallophosphoesterase family protein [Chitinophagaceae bacterium]